MDRRQLLLTAAQGMAGWAMLPGLSMIQASEPAFNHEESLRLCCNENPLGPSAAAKAAIMESVSKGNYYPREQLTALKRAIAEYNNVSPEQVHITPGSFYILMQLGWWAHRHQRSVIGPDYTFDWLLRYAEALGQPAKRISLTTDGYLDLERMLAAVEDNAELVYLCNPNNPTGTYWPQQTIAEFCGALPTSVHVLVDEAYIEYLKVGPSENTANLIAEHPNVMVCRTFSKIYGMAGLRVGYLLASAEIVAELDEWDMGASMAVSNTSAAAAMASLADNTFVRTSVEEREQASVVTRRWLDRWGIVYNKAVANFEHCDVSRFDKDLLGNALKAANIELRPIVREQSTLLRISLGTVQQMEQFGQRMNTFFSS